MSSSPTRRDWLLPAAALTLLVLGTAAVAVALTLALTRPGSPENSSSDSASSPPAPQVPSLSGDQDAVAVAELADPAWVTRTAEATTIPARALAAYAGAALTARTTHPGCGLGWNTLAAIGRVGSGPRSQDGLGPMRVRTSAWVGHATDGNGDGTADIHNIDDAAMTAAVYLCTVGGDLTQPANWITAVSAYNPRKDYPNEVAKVATRYAEADHG